MLPLLRRLKNYLVRKQAQKIRRILRAAEYLEPIDWDSDLLHEHWRRNALLEERKFNRTTVSLWEDKPDFDTLRATQKLAYYIYELDNGQHSADWYWYAAERHLAVMGLSRTTAQLIGY